MTDASSPTPAPDSATAVADFYRYCERLTREQAKNFYYSFVTLPADRRAAMCAVYAFMRRSDDISDEETTGNKPDGMHAWRAQLKRALAGDYGDSPVFPAFHDAVRRYGIPEHYFYDVIDGVEMDLSKVRYATFEELRRYCYLVAGVVGFVCMHVWGFDEQNPDALRIGEACGLALQLTNILRDVREDAERGRIYLPREDLDRFGVTEEELLSGAPSERFKALMEFEAERAAGFYREARGLFPLIKPVGRPTLSVMLGIYGGILEAIRRSGYQVFSHRARVSTPKKLAILGGAWLRSKFVVNRIAG